MIKSLLAILLLVPSIGFSARTRMQPADRITAKAARDGVEFRHKRRVGVGSSFGGAMGLAGIHIDLNLTETTSLSMGYGAGDPFQTFGFSIKRFLSGESFLPYVAGGYTRWSREKADNRAVAQTSPRFFGNKFLNGSEKDSGDFAENILYPSLGLQYVQLNGEWAGFSMFLEIQALVDIDDFQTAPSGALGIYYYF